MKYLTETPMDPVALMSQVRTSSTGAIVLFSGEARDHNDGRSVVRMEYEAYPALAERMIEEILLEAKERFGLHGALCVHRIGVLEISESAVMVLTAASHRKEAYEANRYIINRVKEEVPIWKKEYFSDGTILWGENRPETP